MGNLIAAIVVIAVLAGVMYGAVKGLPWLYVRATRPAAGAESSPNSLNGTWVGAVTVHSQADFMDYTRHGGQGVPPQATAPAVLKVTASSLSGQLTARFRGQVSLCDASGKRYEAFYSDEGLLGGSHINLMLQAQDKSALPDLRGTFTPGQLQVEWPYAEHSTAAGTLTKSTAEDFERMCRDLK